MTVFSHPDFSNHEGVYFASDPLSQLRVIIAVHSTTRGPSAGGTRFWRYESEAEAITDALRLSKAMSYKNAVADLPLGGGKAVVIHPDGEFDRVALFEAYGRAINHLGGRYITAEDVGVSPKDMDVIASQTSFVAGLSKGDAASGDPSPLTADGVFRGLIAASEFLWGGENLQGRSVAVQGLGHVGYALCEKLYKAGAKLIVADINQDAVKKAQDKLEAIIVPVESIHAQEVDIFSPCALGGIINTRSIVDIKAKIIGGAANNQLLRDDCIADLDKRGILYLPDFVLNAGGIINIAAEVSGEYNPDWVEEKLSTLKETILNILKTSKRKNISTLKVAMKIAEDRLKPT